jgi:Flp pilus assembly protein TadB
MKPTAGSGCSPEQREAISHVHPYQEPQRVPDKEVAVVATEQLAEHSPDGRPADRPARGRGRMVLLAILILGLPAVIFGVWSWGGTDALLMGLVYAVVLMLVSYPVWYSGLMRQREEREATDIVRHTLSTERFGPQGRSH